MASDPRIKRQGRTRYKIRQTTNCPYILSVKKTNRYLYLQLDEAENCKTIISMSSKKMDANKPTVELAKKFGSFFVDQLKQMEMFKDALPQVVFDRSGYAYHGKLKAVAEGARESGLRF